MSARPRAEPASPHAGAAALLHMLALITTALGGFLLFLVEPMIAKYILPWFGGSAATWAVSLVFFQAALLAGYLYAYVIAERLPLIAQTALQLVILGAGIAATPIIPDSHWKPIAGQFPPMQILGVLAASVGAPYVILATTSPIIQRWLSRVAPDTRLLRYYAVSNFGAFVALFSYPFVIQPLATNDQQLVGWSRAFIVYCAVFALCAVLAATLSRSARAAIAPDANATDASSPRRAFAWIGWSALGSLLLLAVTNAISEWISVIPLLWIAPLAVYLLTFVLTFGSARIYRRELFLPAFGALAAATLFIGKPPSGEVLALQSILLSCTLFCGCMICQGELYARRPNDAGLTAFYLALAAGGCLGGFAVAFLAPLVFPDTWEYQVGVVAVAVAAWSLEWRQAGALTARPRRVRLAYAAVAAGVVLSAYVALEVYRGEAVVWQTRNFYGVVKLVDNQDPDPDERRLVMFQSGEDQAEMHLAPSRALESSCDFGADSAVGLALRFVAGRRDGAPNAPIRVGVIGMGGGMLAANGKPGDVFRFYELNPAVAEIGERRFPFMRGSQAATDIVLGDGRLTLEREAQSGDPLFDVIVMDAYIGASPPIHLVTREAFELYLRRLKPNGILAIDLDLDNFDLSPLHRGLSQALDLPVAWFDTPDHVDDCDDGVSWALYTRDKGFFDVPEVARARSPWPDNAATTILWTDNYSNLLDVISWGD